MTAKLTDSKNLKPGDIVVIDQLTMTNSLWVVIKSTFGGSKIYFKNGSKFKVLDNSEPGSITVGRAPNDSNSLLTDKYIYYLDRDVFEFAIKSWNVSIETPGIEDGVQKKIEDEDALKIGMMLEVKDTNTGTWVVGMLLHTYECEEHSGIIVCLLRPDGTTVDIDTSYADVYTAPDYNINHFCRTLQRYLHETREKEKLLMHGIRLCKDNENYDKKEETLKAQTFVAKEQPLTVYVPPACWPIEGTNRIDLVGYIKDSINSSPPQLVLACWENGLFNNIAWYSCPVYNSDGDYWINIHMSPNKKYVARHPINMKKVQDYLRLDCEANHIETPNLRTITLVKKESLVVVSTTADQSSIGVAVEATSAETEDIVTTAVDDTLWFQLGWQPQTSVSTYDPMFLAGTRWLKHGNEPDCWVFLANRQGVFKFVIIPMTKALTYFTFEEACAKVQCKVTDLVNSGDLMYIDSVIGRWTNELIEQFCSEHGRSITLKKRLFAPIRIVPTKMPVLQ